MAIIIIVMICALNAVVVNTVAEDAVCWFRSAWSTAEHARWCCSTGKHCHS